MNRPSGSFLALVVLPLALLLLGAASVGWYSARNLEDSRIMVGETNRVLDETRQILILSLSAETSQRGFVLTGNEDYLKPFDQAAESLPRIVAGLHDDLANSPGQLARLASLDGYLQVKIAELSQTVDLRRAQGEAAARQAMTDNTGQAAMNSIRSLVSDMMAAERTVLEQRLLAARQAERTVFTITGGLFVILLAVCVAGGLLFRRNFQRLYAAESELELKARVLQATLDTIAEGIAAFDADGTLTASNKQFFSLVGIPESLTRSRIGVNDLVALDGDGEGLVARLASMWRQDGTAKSDVFETANRTIEVAYNSMPAGGSVFTARDITESRTAEAAMRQAQKMETVGQLTGGVAHDFNNLLQIITTNLDLALRHVDNPALQRRLRNAMVGAERGSKLTRQLLAFARRQPLRPETVNLTRLVRDLTDLLRQTLGEAVELQEKLFPDLWTAMVDRGQIENAIVNLAINARDAMPGGGHITIEASNVVLDEDDAKNGQDIKPGPYVVISVSDTGTGMTPEVLERAFDPFFSTKAEGRGTGLGLSMVYGFTRQSGGHARIVSEVGRGTTVSLYLPRSLTDEEIEQPGDFGMLGGRGETILVVEDEPDVRSAVVLMLEDLGYRALEASNGNDALALVANGDAIDLLFTDVVMPGELQGPALAEQVEQLRPGLPVVFTSGYTAETIMRYGRLQDGVHLLSKPYRKEELARKLRSILGPGKAVEFAGMAAEVEAGEVTTPVHKASEPFAERPGTHRIVFAEDDALVRLATVDMLDTLGYAVHAVADAESAISSIERERPELLLVDVNLAGSDGRDVAKKALAIHPALRVVFATGRDPGDLTGLFPGARVLDKPYGMPELKAMLEDMFGQA